MAVAVTLGGMGQSYHEHTARSLAGNLVEQGSPLNLRRLVADDLQHACRLLPITRSGAAVDQARGYAGGVTGSTTQNLRSYLLPGAALRLGPPRNYHARRVDSPPFRVTLAAAFVVGVVLLPGAVPAGSLEPQSADALGEVLRMLEDPSAHGSSGGMDARTPPTDPRLHALAESPELNQEFYELAAAIFAEMTQAAGGDVSKMDDAVARAKSDPATFAASLSPATRARLRALADRIEHRTR